MEIKDVDIDEIKVVGKLNGKEVKLIRTKGGFNIAMGQVSTNSTISEPLAVGSHSAIVMFNLGKKYKQFQPVMNKSEVEESTKVTEMTYILGDKLQNLGYDLYCLEKSYETSMSLTYQNTEVASFNLLTKNDQLTISNFKINDSKRTKKESFALSKSIQEALLEKAKSLNLKLSNEIKKW